LFVGFTGALGGSVTSITPAALVPNSIAFWDAEHGLIGTGHPTCPRPTCGAGTIEYTADGGRTSRVLIRLAAPVAWVTVAPRGQAWATVATPCTGEPCWSLLHSSDYGLTWRRIGTSPGDPSFADSQHGFALRIGVGCDVHCVVATNDGGRSWHRLREQCLGGAAGVALVTPSRGWRVCVFPGAAGSQEKFLDRTDDGGNSWKRLLAVKEKPKHGLSDHGYPQGIAFAKGGVGVLWESRGTLYLTRDGGSDWQGFGPLELEFGEAGAATANRAFALLSRQARAGSDWVVRLVATKPGTSQWQTVRSWLLRP
jgi:photosystem II stability/assembly factor-like uncharacterized protein